VNELPTNRFRARAATLATLAVFGAGTALLHATARASAVHAGATLVSVGSATGGRAIPAGFLGISTEIPAIESYAGDDPQAIDPVFEQLIRNLAPGQRPVLRIGGDSTDWTWYPVPGMRQPRWVRYTLTPGWLQVTRALTTAVNGRLILGINLEADSPRVAAVEANALIDGIGRGSIAALEIGNEPELYGAFSWYHNAAGRPVPGRPPGYDFGDFAHDFSSIARAVPQTPLAGPATGSPAWEMQLRQFLAAEPRVGLVTLHSYPLERCGTSTHPTVAQLLSESSSRGLADGVARYVALAHARGRALRIDEMNSVACGGESGVSDAFASSLWSLDTLFAMASVGVDGVNFHTSPVSSNKLFTFKEVDGQWEGQVSPDYYGLLMFAQAAPAGARLLTLTGAIHGALRGWATRASNGQIRVVLINTSAARAGLVAVSIPSASASATLERLSAPSLTAKAGVTLGGQSFGAETDSGLLAGAPQTTAVASVGGRYSVDMPPASAAMLTLPGSES